MKFALTRIFSLKSIPGFLFLQVEGSGSEDGNLEEEFLERTKHLKEANAEIDCLVERVKKNYYRYPLLTKKHVAYNSFCEYSKYGDSSKALKIFSNMCILKKVIVPLTSVLLSVIPFPNDFKMKLYSDTFCKCAQLEVSVSFDIMTGMPACHLSTQIPIQIFSNLCRNTDKILP